MRLADVDTPTLIVDLDVLDRNVRDMADHAARYGVALRPHAKTHKSREIAARQLEAGAVGLTLAKLGEVEALLDAGIAGDGLRDVLVAYPIVGEAKLDRLLALAERLHVAVSTDAIEVAARIGRAAYAGGTTLDVLVEIDSGAGRCGVLPEGAVEAAQAVDRIDGVRFRGIMTHEGQAYGATSPDELRAVSVRAGETMVGVAAAIRASGIACPVVSVGSTPSAKHIADVPGVTEVRPGTYVFQDYNQVRLGVAAVEDCAATVLATVVARPAPDRAVIDAGTKAVGADRNMIRVDREGYGLVKGQPAWFFARASEEHGVLLRDAGVRGDDLRIGQRVEVIPNHICPAVNLYDELVGHRGDHVEASIAVLGRGRSR